MSSEKPPSIAPKRPVTAPPRTQTPVGRVTTNGNGQAPDTEHSPSEGQAPVGEAPGGATFADRMRQAANSAREAVSRPSSERPAAERTTPERTTPGPQSDGGPRRVRLSVSRIDPWSVMKLSFLLSVAIGIMIVVAAAVVWQTLNKMAVFTTVNETIGQLVSDPSYDAVLQVVSFSRVISLATMVGVVDVVLLTALSTIMAFLYNIVAALVGGLHLTLTDD
jgi:hypothetical protein